jgi:hypothetical protein
MQYRKGSGALYGSLWCWPSRGPVFLQRHQVSALRISRTVAIHELGRPGEPPSCAGGIADFRSKCSNTARRRPGRTANMVRNQTTDFGKSGAPPHGVAIIWRPSEVSSPKGTSAENDGTRSHFAAKVARGLLLRNGGLVRRRGDNCC